MASMERELCEVISAWVTNAHGGASRVAARGEAQAAAEDLFRVMDHCTCCRPGSKATSYDAQHSAAIARLNRARSVAAALDAYRGVPPIDLDGVDGLLDALHEYHEDRIAFLG